MEVDIATLLENHRKHMLAGVDSIEYDSEQERENSKFAIAHAHDRATTRTLLDLYRSGQQGGNGQPGTPASTTTATAIVTPPSRKVKAGSKKAKDRALKAGETRRKNLALKKADAASAGSSFSTGTPVTVNTTTSEAGEGGGQ